MLGYNAFLSIDEIIEWRQIQNDLFADEEPIEHISENKVQPVIWDKNWLPFTNYEGSTMMILDFNAGKNGKNGQLITYSPAEDLESDDIVIADSFEAFSQKILSCLKENRYDITDEVIELDLFI